MIYDSHGEDMDERAVFDEMNPAVSLFCLVLLSVSYILVDSLLGHLFALAFLFTLIYLSQLDFTVVTTAIKKLVPLLFFVFLLNFCFASPPSAFFRWWVFAPSVQGGLKGLSTSVKIIEIVVIFDIFNALTESVMLIPVLCAVLRPLSLLGISHEQIAITVYSALWFFSFMKDKSAQISVMQKSSGVLREESGGRRFDPAGKMRLFTPLLYESVNAAREKAILFEARGVPEYLRENTKIPSHVSMYDYCAMTVCAAFFAVQLIIF